VQWEQHFGGSGNDWSHSVQQTSDGGYIIAGGTDSFGTDGGDIYLIKTEPNGKMEWQKHFGGSDRDDGYSVQQTADGGYIITGFISGDICLIKTDPNGDLQWGGPKTFGGSDYWDCGWSVQQTSDKGYIIVGTTFNWIKEENQAICLIKTDPNGEIDGGKGWQKTFGGNGYDWDWGYSVKQTIDGGYIITGEISGDVCLIKTEPNGTMEWQKAFGDGVGLSVQQNTDGGYVIVGNTPDNICLIKTDSNGNNPWQQTIWLMGNGFGSGRQTADGGYIFVGFTDDCGGWCDSNVWLMRVDPDGDLLWSEAFGGSDSDGGRSVQQTADGGYIVAGSTRSFGAVWFDVYLIKLSNECGP
jgi:hypothetical protein